MRVRIAYDSVVVAHKPMLRHSRYNPVLYVFQGVTNVIAGIPGDNTSTISLERDASTGLSRFKGPKIDVIWLSAKLMAFLPET